MKLKPAAGNSKAAETHKFVQKTCANEVASCWLADVFTMTTAWKHPRRIFHFPLHYWAIGTPEHRHHTII